MQDLWAKDIVDSIWTALCSFLHSDLIWCVCTNWNIFTRKEKNKDFKIRYVMRIPGAYLKISVN